MRRPQRYNQLYILGAGLKRERPDSMREWRVTSVTSPSIARGDDDETSSHRCARGKRAMRRPHATISLILEALVSRESDDRERRLRDEAHAIDHRWTSSDDGSRDDDKKTVASEGENEDEDDHDNFAVAMSPPAKKAKKSHRVVSKETRKRRASGERPTREV
jgi:hypothetical protein